MLGVLGAYGRLLGALKRLLGRLEPPKNEGLMQLLCTFNLKAIFDRFRWDVNPIRAEFQHVRKPSGITKIVVLSL